MNMNKVDYEFFNNNKYIIRSKIDEEINFWKKLEIIQIKKCLKPYISLMIILV